MNHGPGGPRGGHGGPGGPPPPRRDIFGPRYYGRGCGCLGCMPIFFLAITSILTIILTISHFFF